jgi:hypothetical protein
LLINGQFTTVDNPNAGPGGSYVAGINNAGTLVGFYLDSAGVGHGYEATPTRGNSAADGAAAPPSPLTSAPSALLVTPLTRGATEPARGSPNAGASSPAVSSGMSGTLSASPVSQQLVPPYSVRLWGAANPTRADAVDRLFAELDSPPGDALSAAHPF